MRYGAVLAAVLLLLAAPGGAQGPEACAVGAEGCGSLTGHVRLTARVKAPLPANAYPSRSIGRHDPPPMPEIRNVVVYLKDPRFHGALPVSRVELHQQNETFVPHVLAITRGSSVDFPQRRSVLPQRVLAGDSRASMPSATRRSPAK